MSPQNKKNRIAAAITGTLLVTSMGMGFASPAFAAPEPDSAGTEAITSGQANALKAQKAQIIEFEKLINDYRKSQGVAPLTFNSGAATDAVDWSKTQAGLGTLQHQTPDDRWQPFNGLWNNWGENVAYNYTPGVEGAKEMFQQWKDSPGHRANMLNPKFTTYGIGFHADSKTGRTYGTTVFYSAWDGTRLPDTYTSAPDYFAGKPALPTDGSNPKPVPAGPFKDVPVNSSFHTHIKWLKDNKITTGYTDGTYGVNKKITRGEVASFLYRISGDKHNVTGKTKFKDLNSKSAHYTAIEWMTANGYTNGYTDGTFRPNQEVTRAELASFTYRASEEDFTAPKVSPFRDVKTNSSHYESIAWLRAAGNVTGYVDGSFKPGRDITRGETAKMLYALK